MTKAERVGAVARVLMGAVIILSSACGTADAPPADTPRAHASKRRAAAPAAMLDLDVVQRRTFDFFWETANPRNGLVPDRWPAKSFSSIAAVGFGLTAYGIGAERGYITREQAADRVLTTLNWFMSAPAGTSATGMAGYRGFFYHFLDMETGARFKEVELSTIDTTLLLAGALFCQSYFDRDNDTERAIRSAAEELYTRADWQFFLARPPLVSMGWTPEHGLHDYDYRGFDEAMILYILALGSPTHPIDPSAWEAFTATYKWQSFYEQQHVTFGPLFGHHYSHVWIDFKGIQDAYMREHGIDYFENTRRATYAQRAYAIANPGGWRGYGENMWGLSACDGPLDGTLTIDGKPRTFYTYSARGAAPGEIRDDGTLAPTAPLGSLPFAPEIAIPAMNEMYRRLGTHVFRQYGFIDSFNETLTTPLLKVQMGAVVPGIGWFDADYLGIDQGPIVAMIENYRSGLVWKTMQKNPHVVRGLRRAGFTGGWLDQEKSTASVSRRPDPSLSTRFPMERVTSRIVHRDPSPRESGEKVAEGRMRGFGKGIIETPTVLRAATSIRVTLSAKH